MNTLIQTLKNTLVKPDTFMHNLGSVDGYSFKDDYPVAIVHHQKRIKEEDVIGCLQNEGYLNADGHTLNTYDEKKLINFDSCAEGYVKKVRLMCFSSEIGEGYTFKEKYSGDYWKKIVDPGNFTAVIEVSHYEDGEDICKIEFDLRELMRSSKEVPSLKVLPYVWVVKVDKGVPISSILKHYYGENFELIERGNETIAIGWSPTLQEVNMRYFVCPPA